MQHVKKYLFLLLLLCFTINISSAQHANDTLFIAHKKSSPDFFTLFIQTEKTKETIDVYNGLFPNQNLVYTEKLKRVDTIIKRKKYLFIGKKSAVYKKGNSYYAEFTGFEDEGYKTKLSVSSSDKAFPDIAKNCNYKVKQVAQLKYHLDSALGRGNYTADLTSFDDENYIYSMLNNPFKEFKDSIDLKVKKFYSEFLKHTKPELEKLQNIKRNIDKISYTTAREFIIHTNVKTNIEKDIIYSIAEKQPAILIELLEKESVLIQNKNEIFKTFFMFGEQKEKYNTLLNSIYKTQLKCDSQKILLQNLKKGKRHANYLKTMAFSGGILLLISIPVAFLVIMNL